MALFLSPIAPVVREELKRRVQETDFKKEEDGQKVGNITNVPGKLIDQSLSAGYKDVYNQSLYARSTWMRVTPSTQVKLKDKIESKPILAGGLLNSQGQLRAGLPQSEPNTISAADFSE